MNDRIDLVLVLPCYNEATRAPWQKIEAFVKNDPAVAIVLVDDGSKDNTADIICNLAKKYPRKMIARVQEKNQGKATAVQIGMLAAVDQWPKADHIGYFDADLATPLEEAREMLCKVAKAEPVLIIGSRVKLLGATNIERDPSRHYFGRVFATVVSNMLHLAVYDTQCGAKLVRTDQVPTLFNVPFSSAWLFDIELIWRCMIHHGRKNVAAHIHEVPLSSWMEKGESRIPLSYLFKVPRELWRIRQRYRKMERTAQRSVATGVPLK